MLSPEERHQIAQQRHALAKRAQRIEWMLRSATPRFQITDTILREALDETRQELHLIDQSVAIETQRPRQIGLLR